MNEKQLNDFPEEILLQVFDKMEVKTLMESSAVCRKWNEMIEANSAIMNKIKLVVRVSSEKIRLLPKEFTRNYRSIKILGNFKDEFDWTLLTQASSLKKLELYRCEVREELIAFLSRQKNLKELAIRDCNRVNINLEALQAIQFPLKKLSIDGHECLCCDENLLLFIEKFANTLEDLHIGHRFPASVYEKIFEKFHKLNTLCVNFDFAPKEDSFYYNLNTNLSVKKLIVHSYDYSDDMITVLEKIEGFIDKLPNLRSLDLTNSRFPKELMMFIADNLKMLEELEVFGISDEDFDEVTIPSLKKIKIELLNIKKPEDQEHQIFRALPNIEEFRVEGFSGENDENLKLIAVGWPKLKHVKLGYGFKARKEIVELFLQNCKDLKTIEIYETAFESDSEKEEILREVKRDEFRFVINKCSYL